MAGTNTLLMVADSKLLCYSNITALLQAGVDFIAPAPAAQSRACGAYPAPSSSPGVAADV
ncbi:hypothetical protein ACGFSI_40370 [Streptomyces virginiae]|uniref:hypothetical protein n=1 Tax=Streptomyces virginiae TaxID=1961 RepID=UPI00371EB15A